MQLPNVEVIWDTVVNAIEGKDGVESINLTNKKTGEKKKLSVDGVFIAIGTRPDTDVLKGVVDLNERGYVIADETGATNVPGIYAAGDLRTKELRQIVTAAADGANSVFAVEKYLMNS